MRLQEISKNVPNVKTDHNKKQVKMLTDKLIKAGKVVDNNPGIDVPVSLRGGNWTWNFEKKSMPLVDKITWILTAANVAILISLVIKNIWMK